MAKWYFYEPALLEESELEFDLSVRNMVGLSSRRTEITALRTEIQKECNEVAVSYRNLREQALEIQCALFALISITKSLDKITPSTKNSIIDCTKARVSHWLNRLNSFEQPTDTLIKSIEEFECLLVRIESGGKNCYKDDINRSNEGAVGGNISIQDSGVPLFNAGEQNLNYQNRTSLPGMGRGRGSVLAKTGPSSLFGSQNFLNPSSNLCEIEQRRSLNAPLVQNSNNNNNHNLSGSSNDFDVLFNRLNMGNNKRLRMYHWNAIFNGNGQGLSLNEFLTRVNIYARGENVTEDQLLANIHLLLKGKAEHWFWGNINEFRTWTEFVAAIKREFLPQNYDFFLREEIQNRIQNPNESFSAFITDMKILFQRADPPLDENFKLYIVRRNMLPDYGAFLATMNIITLNDLITVCRKLDESRLMVERRNMSRVYPGMSLVEPSCFPAPINRENFQRKVSFKPQVSCLEPNISNFSPVESFASNNHRGNISNNDLNLKNFSSADSSTSFQNDNVGFGISSNTNWGNSFNYPMQNEFDNSQISFNNSQDVCSVNQARNRSQEYDGGNKGSKFICFNCKQAGHSHNNCEIPRRRVFCFSCGADGVRASNCSNCAKNKKSNSGSNNGNSMQARNFSNQENSQQGGR